METPFITHAPISRESEPNCTASPDFWVTNSATSGGICVFKFRGAFTDLFSEKQDAPTTGAESQAVVQAVIPHAKNSPKETRLQPDVWWLSSHIVSFISMPRLSSSILSPPNCLCSRPVIISPLTNISISSFCQPCHYYSPLPALISHFPFPFPFHHDQSLCYAFPVLPYFFPPFYPSYLTFIPSISRSSFSFHSLSTQFRQKHPHSLGSAGFGDMLGTSPVLSDLALPSWGRFCTSLHWSIPCADASFGVQIKTFKPACSIFPKTWQQGGN